MKVIYKILSFGIAVSVVVAAFRAHFMVTVDSINRIVYDGLGRELSETPWWARFLLGKEKAWAGLGWHLLDILWFFGGLALAFWLYRLSED